MVRRAAAAASILLVVACGRGERTVSARPPSAAATAAPSEPAVDTEDVADRTRRAPGARPPVIWLGFDGFDWELLDRLVSEGRMPNWKRFVSEGWSANLRSYVPLTSPIVWTTLATGVGPDVHRILEFQEVDPASGQKVPISGRSRAVPAIWNVASASGLTVGVVGWWATHPAEEVKGFFVSDHASAILLQGLSRNGLAYPASIADGVERTIARSSRVPDAEIRRYLDVPGEEIVRARQSGQGLENPIMGIERTIGATRAAARIGRELYDRNLPDLTMVYFEGTDVIGHLFGAYAPPRLDCVTDADYARYHGAVDEYYALIDRLLGQWMRRAAEDGATLIVNSDHGLKWGAERTCQTAGFSWHRIDGVFAAWGARVRPSRVRGSASVFDVEPTVAALLGLPVDSRAPGHPIRAAFETLPAPERRDLVATVPVRRLEGAPTTEQDASEYAKKLMALGYLSGSSPGKLAPTGGDRPGMTEGAWNNLGLYESGNPGRVDFAAAEAAYRKALELRPDYDAAMLNLAALHRLRGDDRQAVDELFRALAAGWPDPQDLVLAWARNYQVRNKRREAREVLERGARAYPDDERIQCALALDDYAAKECPRADRTLTRFEASTRSPETLNALALIRACLGRRDDAVALFRRSLSLDPGQKTVEQSLELLQRGAAPGR
jgi:predicted AlkP superfamily phosphohydrolase/phosphomutase